MKMWQIGVRTSLEFQRQCINQVLRKYVRLSLCIRILLLFSFVVLILIFFVCFIYMDLQLEKNKYMSMLNNLSSRAQKKAMYSVVYEEKRHLYASLESKSADRAADIFKLMDEAAQKNNVRVISIKPGKNEQQIDMDVSRYHLNISGEYISIVCFLKTFLSMEKLISFSDISLSIVDPKIVTDDKLLLVLEVQAYGRKR